MMNTKYPPPIYGTEPGSWARSTVLDRLPQIAGRVMDENEFPGPVVDKLIQLKNGIPDQLIRSLNDRHAPDAAVWEGYLEPQVGKNWLEVPWFFAEHYFYRRIMEAVDYFNVGSDPFFYQKEQGLIKTREDIQAYASVITQWLKGGGKVHNLLWEALLFSLWGNQADLSLWPAGSSGTPKHTSQKSLKEHLLADDSSQILRLLTRKSTTEKRVDLMLDNAGFELVCDLGLADTILTHHLAGEVNLHVKAHPTFVSDVISQDIDQTVDFLQKSEQEETRNLGDRLEKHFRERRIRTVTNFFWNSPLPMWELPSDLRQELSGSDLLISKGDANYRRLLGDRQWDFTLPFHQVVDYLSVPLVALRTLKAELAVGLDLDQIRETYNQDPNWMVDGKWGVVHFAPGTTPRPNKEYT